jgi:hypothetical protein
MSWRGQLKAWLGRGEVGRVFTIDFFFLLGNNIYCVVGVFICEDGLLGGPRSTFSPRRWLGTYI